MTAMRTATLAAVLAALACGGSAAAQPPGPPPTRPAYSPYLNLLRQGNSPTVNYFGLVRPELAARQSIQAVQSAVSTNQRTIQDLMGGELGTTGVSTQFQNHLGYFQNQRSGGIGVGVSGAGGAAGRGR